MESHEVFVVVFGTTVMQLPQQQQIPIRIRSGQALRDDNKKYGIAIERRRDYSTVFIRVPMPSMVIWISSLLWSVKESGGTMPVPVSRKQP